MLYLEVKWNLMDEGFQSEVKVKRNVNKAVFFSYMVVREYMSSLQNKVQFPIQKHSSSQNGCDSQLDEKTFLSYLTAKPMCSCFSCEVTAVPRAGEWVIELCGSKSPLHSVLWC